VFILTPNRNFLQLNFLCAQGALILFYTARIALLKGNFTFVSVTRHLSLSLSFAAIFFKLLFKNGPWFFCVYVVSPPAGQGEVPRLHRRPAGVAADPPPVLLGAHVGPFLRAGLEEGLPLRRPAGQGEQVVPGTANRRSEHRQTDDDTDDDDVVVVVTCRDSSGTARVLIRITNLTVAITEGI